jgi:hypothetical protein
MSDEPELVPVLPDDLQRTLAFALVYDGKKRFRRGEDLMAQIVAEHLMQHLKMSGWVVMRRKWTVPTGGGQKRVQPPAALR